MSDLLAAVCISAVLAGMALPLTTGLLAEYRLSTAIDQLSHEIATARMQAIAQNQTVRIRFVGDGSYVIETSRDLTNYTVSAGPVALPSGISASSGQTIQFNRQGIAPSQVATTISNSAGTKYLQTNPLGRTTLVN